MNHCSNVRKTLRVAACSEKPSEFKLRDFLVLAYFHYIIKSPKRNCCKFHLSESSPKQCPNKNKKKKSDRCCPRLARELVQQQGDLGQGRAAASALGFLQGLTDNLGWKLGMFQPQLRLNHTIY